MNAFVKNILATVIAAAVCANVAILFQFGERLARIETKIEALSKTPNNLAQNYEH